MGVWSGEPQNVVLGDSLFSTWASSQAWTEANGATISKEKACVPWGRRVTIALLEQPVFKAKSEAHSDETLHH